MIIDFHSHWIPPALAQALRQRDSAPKISKANPEINNAEQLQMPVGSLPFDAGFTDIPSRLKMMDLHKIQLQVLSLPCLFGLDSLPFAQSKPLIRLFNEATSDIMRRHPTRFSGLAALPFADIEQAADEYRFARRELGLLGAIVPIDYFNSIEQAKKIQPLLDMANFEGGHLFLHPGRRADAALEQIGEIYPDSIMARRQLHIQHQVANAMVTLLWGGIFDQYQGFTLHVANMAGTLPLVVERMDFTSQLRTFEPVLPSKRLQTMPFKLDCSSMGPIAIKAALAAFGADKIMFGSDHPIYRSDWQINALAQVEISDTEKQAILYGNARQILDRWH